MCFGDIERITLGIIEVLNLCKDIRYTIYGPILARSGSYSIWSGSYSADRLVRRSVDPCPGAELVFCLSVVFHPDCELIPMVSVLIFLILVSFLLKIQYSSAKK